MNIDLLSRIFRSLVVLSFLSLFVYAFLDMNIFIESQYDLSPMLEETNNSIGLEMGIFGSIVLLLLLIVVHPLLFFYAKWSRELFIFIVLFVILIDLLDASLGKYILVSSTEDLLNHSMTYIEGIIIALAYFSPLKDKFK
tara:strand:+ start:93 stop:512 length:420 start_codon:yes stop_codon:yes gene_type:complete